MESNVMSSCSPIDGLGVLGYLSKSGLSGGVLSSFSTKTVAFQALLTGKTSSTSEL